LFAEYDVGALGKIVVVCAINNLGKLAGKVKGDYPAAMRPLFAKLVRRAEETLVGFGGREVSNVLHGVAVSGFFDDADLARVAFDLFSAVLSHIRRIKLQSFNALAIANSSWAVRVAGVSDRDFFALVAADLRTRDLAAFDHHMTANLIIALAEAREPDVLRKLLQHMGPSMLGKCSVKDLVAMLTALAKAEEREIALPLFERVAGILATTRMHATLLADVAWAYGKLGVRAEPLLVSMANALVAMDVDVLSTGDLVSTMWSFATLDHPAPAVFKKLGHVLADRLPGRITALAVLDLVRAFSSTGCRHAALVKSLTAHLTSIDLGEFRTRELARIASLLPAMSEGPVLSVLGVFADECARRGLRNAAPETVCSWVMALSDVGMVHDALLAHVNAELRNSPLAPYSVQQLTDVSVDLATLGRLSAAAALRVANELAAREAKDFEDVSPFLWAAACAGVQGVLGALLRKDLPVFTYYAWVVAAWRAEVRGPLPPLLNKPAPTLSAVSQQDWHRALADKLRARGWSAQLGYVTAHGVLVDMLVGVGTRQVAVQFREFRDLNLDGSPSGHGALRLRLARAAVGIAVCATVQLDPDEIEMAAVQVAMRDATADRLGRALTAGRR